MPRSRALKIILSGAYGMGNLGDEAICRSVMADIEAAHPGVKLRVFTFDAHASRLAHPTVPGARFLEFFSIIFCPWSIRSWVNIGSGIWNIIGCDILIFGGGGLIRNRTQWLERYLWPVRIAQWFQKQVAICCIGVDVLADPEVVKLVQDIRQPVFASVRDQRSEQNLLRAHPSLLGVKVIADPAFHLFSRTPRATTRAQSVTRIGLNLTTWKADFSEQKQLEVFINGLVSVLDTIAKSGKSIHLVYLSTVPRKDAEIYQRLRDRLADRYPIETPLVQTPEAYVNSLASLDLFIGMRLHSLILSSLIEDLPTSVISYDEKTDALQSVFEEQFFRITDIIERPEGVAKLLIESLDVSRTGVDWTTLRTSSESLVSGLRSLFSEREVD
jgi:polysaccharide pyruvyl transferase WcaK-like protein